MNDAGYGTVTAFAYAYCRTAPKEINRGDRLHRTAPCTCQAQIVPSVVWCGFSERKNAVIRVEHLIRSWIFWGPPPEGGGPQKIHAQCIHRFKILGSRKLQ